MKDHSVEFPLVSVVIPVYNRQDTIERAVNSVIEQTYKNIELIVVDDGSMDNTLEIVEQLGIENIKLLKQNHRGANAARNLGITVAKGEFIAFQDSDDEWLPDKLERQITYMLENGYEVCYCPFILYEKRSFRPFFDDYKDKEKYEKNLSQVLRVRNVVSTQTLVIHRNVVLDVGLFDEEILRCQDYEFVIRVIQKKKIGYINELLVKVYRTNNSISNDTEKQKQADIILLKKHGNFFDIESSLKNTFEHCTDGLSEHELNKEVERIDKYLENVLDKRRVNVYKIAMEVLNHKYIFSDSYAREYELRVRRLQSDRFAIYGAGNIGKKIYLELAKKNLMPQCFFVTKKQEDEQLFGIPILELAQWENKDIEIIIGVSRTIQIDLIENLVHGGYTNYFRYPY